LSRSDDESFLDALWMLIQTPYSFAGTPEAVPNRQFMRLTAQFPSFRQSPGLAFLHRRTRVLNCALVSFLVSGRCQCVKFRPPCMSQATRSRC
jgi:hypothetical protein